MSTHENIRYDIYVNIWKYKKWRGSHNMQCCCTVRCKRPRARRQCLWGRTVWLMARKRTMAVRLTLAPQHVLVGEYRNTLGERLRYSRRVSQIPRWVTKLTVSTERDLFVRAIKILRCRWRWQSKCCDVDDDGNKDVRRHWLGMGHTPLGMGHPRESEPDLRVASGASWRAQWQQGKRTCERRLVITC